MSRGCLIDLTRCIGCRACQVACKQWNKLPAETTEFFAHSGGYQNPPGLSPKTYTVVTYHEVKDAEERLKWIFAKRQCMHCLEPSCVSACLVKALEKRKEPEGPVVWREDLCMGCRYCMIACPFDVPKFEYDRAVPDIRKCTFCFDRQEDGQRPACEKACPTRAIEYGERDELLKIAKTRIYQDPDKYVDHIYGEHEAGGTNWMYISPVAFEKLGFPMNVGTTPYPEFTKSFLTAVPLVIVMWGGLLTGFHWFANRRDELGEAEAASTEGRSTS